LLLSSKDNSILTKQETFDKIYDLVREKQCVSLEMLCPELCFKTKEVVTLNLQELWKQKIPDDLLFADNNGETFLVTKEFFISMCGDKNPLIFQSLFQLIKYFFKGLMQ